MNRTTIHRCANVLAATVLCLVALPLRAHLPHPIQATGTVLAVDHATQTLVFKTAKNKKSFVLDWNKDTQIIENGVVTNATALKAGVSAVISYKDVSFRNPLLKKVAWETRGARESEPEAPRKETGR